MNIPADSLSFHLSLTASAIWVAVLVVAAWRAPWRRFRHAHLQPVFLGALVALMLLWSFDARLAPGLGFHFLGVTVFTLMFGWSLAVIGISLASLAVSLHAGSGMETWAPDALVLGVLPVSVSYGIYYLVDRYLPHHIFVYIFLCAFLGAIASAGVAVLTLVAVLVAAEAYTFARIAQEYLPFLPLYLFPEGFLNGMLTTVFVGLRPQWLKTFDDESYLGP